jgi:outer membrane receptor protein involved in Fe transport
MMAQAQQKPPAPGQPVVEEVVVTGSRIVRDGYEAPTPVAVVGVEQLQTGATANVADYVNTMPVFSGSATPQTSQPSVSGGTAGVNALNLRNLGANRTLVLFDGQRSVPSLATGVVDVNSIPQALISRVDVVTGGASSAYGSDAVAGVVNFILDKEFTGVKGEVSGGITTHGDNETWQVQLTAGLPFASGRGHVLLSGEVMDKAGIMDGNRDWNLEPGWGTMTNPAYGTGPGQSTSVPERLVLGQIGGAGWADGSLITAGPLKGIAFGQGGRPYNFVYGDLVSGLEMRGGQWKAGQVRGTKGNSIDSKQENQSIFGRASYDVTESVNVFLQGSYTYSGVLTRALPQINPANLSVRVDNPYLPAEIAARAQALNVTSFTLGTLHPDLPGNYTDNRRDVVRWVTGANGTFNALATDWTWDAYYQFGIARSEEDIPYTLSKTKFALSMDSVRNANGTIVCRSTLTNPTNGCIPYNPFGIGVNGQAAVDWIGIYMWRHQKMRQDVAAVNFGGEAFDLPAGPVSLAFGGEWRRERISGVAADVALANDGLFGNSLPSFGTYNVKEAYLETVVPLVKGAAWAESLELNGAVRATDYSQSGFVATWKVGAVYQPIPDIRFRATRSRDIRAPNLNEYFAGGTSNTNTVLDRFNNSAPVSYQGFNQGNSALDPEKADALGVGVVLQPSFLRGFSASVDYFDVKIKDAIGTVSAQTIVDYCFEGNAAFCAAITRGPNAGGVQVIQRIRIQPFNLALQQVKGYDLESSYRFDLADVVEGWTGAITLRGLASRTLKDYIDNTVNPPEERAGAENPKWRYSAQINYNLFPFTASLAARGRSKGKWDDDWIECTTGCPVSNVTNITINQNLRDGTFYMDASFSYDLAEEDADWKATAFLNVRNLFDTDPARQWPGPAGNGFRSILAECGNGSDCNGRTLRLGVRFSH